MKCLCRKKAKYHAITIWVEIITTYFQFRGKSSVCASKKLVRMGLSAEKSKYICQRSL